MDPAPDLSQELRDLQQAARADGAALPVGVVRASFDQIGEKGYFGLPISVAQGGTGKGVLATVVAWEGLGQGCPDLGLLFAAGAHLWGGVLPLALHAPAALQSTWLPGAIAGTTLLAHAVSEPSAGSDVCAMACAAVPDGDELILTGHKRFVTLAPVADGILIYARDGRRAGSELMSCFVNTDAWGMTITEQRKSGLRSAPMGEIRLDGVRIPAEHALSAPGAGMAVFQRTITLERAAILAPFVGAMARLLDSLQAFARKRKQFGQPLSRFQAVSHGIVEMRTRVDIARMMLYRTARLLDAGERATSEAAQAKVWISEAFVRNATEAMTLRGAEAYLEGSEEAEAVADGVAAPLFSGANPVLRNLMARLMGL